MVGGIFGTIAYTLAFFLSSWLSSDQNLSLLVICVFYAIAGYGISSMVPSFYSAAGHVKGLSTSAALSRMFLFNTLVAIVARMFMGGLIDRFNMPLALLFPIATFVIATVISGLVANRQNRIDQVLGYAPTSPITALDVAD